MEDTWLGKVTERLFLPFLRLALPEIADLNLPEFGVFHNAAFVSIRKQYPQHARKVMHALWGLGQLMFTKLLVVVDAEVDVQDQDEVLFHLGANCDFSRDLELARGPAEVLDHAVRQPLAVGKLGLDATRKRPEEGAGREWPEALKMDPEVAARVAEQMRRAGLPDRQIPG
jgi:4-hydroxy-3-polyprenylbenzoate decarboxylase